jgi:hypothetical protein
MTHGHQQKARDIEPNAAQPIRESAESEPADDADTTDDPDEGRGPNI